MSDNLRGGGSTLTPPSNDDLNKDATKSLYLNLRTLPLHIMPKFNQMFREENMLIYLMSFSLITFPISGNFNFLNMASGFFFLLSKSVATFSDFTVVDEAFSWTFSDRFSSKWQSPTASSGHLCVASRQGSQNVLLACAKLWQNPLVQAIRERPAVPGIPTWRHWNSRERCECGDWRRSK